ncbi:transketolase [Corynebacterium glyciniphilum]|uniref:transketolase n=1 Tax=Corynebacterium glyciniphilum TaxID=1404244 RepID=UPI0011AB382D|nr:transketolase [Corynebacterium glyciniphilum]
MTSPQDVIDPERVQRIRESAYRIRQHAITQAELQGQGYIGQALDLSDILAVLYTDQLVLNPHDTTDQERDRCFMSMGHYGLALYAALVEAKFLPEEELQTYAADDSRLPMSAMAVYTPGVEISGGSLGHGLPIALGAAIALLRRGGSQIVVNLLSDGELDEGSTWEAAKVAGDLKLKNIVAVVDVNGQQADGPTRPGDTNDNSATARRFEAFGWTAHDVDGHDVEALIRAMETARAADDGKPHVLVCRTVMGKGVPMLENRDKLHFMRVDEEEWIQVKKQLKEGFTNGE